MNKAKAMKQAHAIASNVLQTALDGGVPDDIACADGCGKCGECRDADRVTEALDELTQRHYLRGRDFRVHR